MNERYLEFSSALWRLSLLNHYLRLDLPECKMLENLYRLNYGSCIGNNACLRSASFHRNGSDEPSKKPSKTAIIASLL